MRPDVEASEKVGEVARRLWDVRARGRVTVGGAAERLGRALCFFTVEGTGEEVDATLELL